MRYLSSETIYCYGTFEDGDTVTITIYNRTDSLKPVDGAFCGTSIDSSGTFEYAYTPTVIKQTNYLWIMTNGSYDFRGSFTVGGWPDAVKARTDLIPDIPAEAGEYTAALGTITTALTFLHDIEGGRWRIVDNQMIFYKSDNETEVARFNLFDADGNPAMENIFDRQRV